MALRPLAVAAGLAVFAPLGARAQCTSDDQCRGTRVCVEGACQNKGCSVDTDCTDPLICEQGACIQPALPPAPAPAPVPSRRPPPPGYGDYDYRYDDGGRGGYDRGYDDDYYEPRRRRRSPRRRRYRTRSKSSGKGLAVGGGVVLGVAWLATWTTTLGLVVNNNGEGQDVGFAAIPVAGPFVMLGVTDIPNDTETALTGLLVLSGIAQTAGVVMLVVGLAVGKKKKNEPYALTWGDPADGLSVSISPAGPAGSQAGVSALVRF